MDIGGEGVGVYAEAKGEYTRQLCQYVVPALQSFFLKMLDEAKAMDPDSKRGLINFQKLLEGVTDWNIDKVRRETSAVIAATNCDYMEELLTAVFIAYTKILSAIRLTTRHKKLQITIPKLDHFMHRTMTECARLLWTNTYLFSSAGTSIERQKNMRQIEGLINDGVNQSIRSMLPVKSILKEYLHDDEKDEEKEEEKEEKPEVAEVAKVEGVEIPEVPKVEEPEVAEIPKIDEVEKSEESVKPEESVKSEGSEKVEGSETAIASTPVPTTSTPVPTTSTPATPTTPTIIVGSESDSRVQFTGLDSVFDSENPEGSNFKAMTEEMDFTDALPEAMDGFDIIGEESLPMDEFEEL